MLEKLGFRKRTSNLDDILDDLSSSRRLRGYYNGHKWTAVIGQPKGDGFEELYEGAWRKNPVAKELLICGWQDDAALEDYLSKRARNVVWIETQTAEYKSHNPRVEKEWPALFEESVRRIENQVPFAPLELAHSNLAGFEFDLASIQHKIWEEENLLMAKLGVLPKKPSVIGIWKGAHGIQAVLRVEWEQR